MAAARLHRETTRTRGILACHSAFSEKGSSRNGCLYQRGRTRSQHFVGNAHCTAEVVAVRLARGAVTQTANRPSEVTMTPETCVDCGATPPQADTSYSAIGHGWRVQARETPGARVMEWRCAGCWKARRAK